MIHFGKDAGVWTSLAGGHSGGRDFFYPEYTSDTASPIAGNSRGVDGLDVGTWTGRAWWKALSVQWSLNSQRKHLPTGQFDTLIDDARTRQTDSRGMAEARFEPKISDEVQSLTRAHVNYYGYRAGFAHDPTLGGFERQTYDGTWTGLEQRFVYSPWKVARLTLGGEGQLHLEAKQYGALETSGTYLYDNRTFQIGAGYFVADVTPNARTKISVGGRLDWYSTFGLSFNPRLAFIFAPYERGNVKLLFGKAFRAPSIYELAFTAGGGQLTNPNIKPENMYSAEIEYSHRFDVNVVGLISTYGNYITDLIAQRPIAGAAGSAGYYSYQNTDVPVLTLGAETELRREWKDGWVLGVSYSFQHSQYLSSASLSDLFGYSKNPNFREVPNAPEHLASLRAGLPILSRALLAMTRVSVQGPRFDRNDDVNGPPQGKVDGAVIWDLVLSGTEQHWGLRYNLGLYNLLDWRYLTPVSPEFRQTAMVQNGRTLLTNVQVTF
jgi:outer membrane cobalamin receptor